MALDGLPDAVNEGGKMNEDPLDEVFEARARDVEGEL